MRLLGSDRVMRRNIFALLLAVAVLALIAWAVDKYIQPILPSAFTSPAVFFIGSAIAIVGILGSLGSAQIGRAHV